MKKQNFVFFDTGSGDESKVLRVTEGVSVMAVQVSGTSGYDLAVKGQTDLETDDWAGIAGVAVGGLSKVTSITEDGIYYFPVLACHSVKMVNDGTTGAVKAHAWFLD